MTKINTAERVSAEASDNFVFQRSLLAYHAAAERIAGNVLEIGTGSGYGIEVVAPRAGGSSPWTSTSRRRHCCNCPMSNSGRPKCRRWIFPTGVSTA